MKSLVVNVNMEIDLTDIEEKILLDRTQGDMFIHRNYNVGAKEAILKPILEGRFRLEGEAYIGDYYIRQFNKNYNTKHDTGGFSVPVGGE